MLHRPDQSATIRALRNASPYIRLYKGKIFIIKAGGGVFDDGALLRALIEQIAILHYLGIRVVLVHGGGQQLSELTAALGVPTRTVQGRRITDARSIEATSMVLNGLIFQQAQLLQVVWVLRFKLVIVLGLLFLQLVVLGKLAAV